MLILAGSKFCQHFVIWSFLFMEDLSWQKIVGVTFISIGIVISKDRGSMMLTSRPSLTIKLREIHDSSAGQCLNKLCICLECLIHYELDSCFQQ